MMKSKILILGMALIVVALGIALVMGMLQPRTLARPPASASPLQLGNGQSARRAYAALQNWPAWTENTGIIAASASLQRGEGSGGWTFQVYTPGTQQLSVLVVDGEQIIVLNQPSVFTPQHIIDMATWTVDSDAALQQWWQARGQRIWTGPEAQSLYLNLSVREDQSTWQLTVLDTSGELLDFWEMPASGAP